MKEIEVLKTIFKDSPDILEPLNEIDKEIERLNNIIKEAREYADEWNSNWYATGSEEDHQRLHELLEILDKEKV